MCFDNRTRSSIVILWETNLWYIHVIPYHTYNRITVYLSRRKYNNKQSAPVFTHTYTSQSKEYSTHVYMHQSIIYHYNNIIVEYFRYLYSYFIFFIYIFFFTIMSFHNQMYSNNIMIGKTNSKNKIQYMIVKSRV